MMMMDNPEDSLTHSLSRTGRCVFFSFFLPPPAWAWSGGAAGMQGGSSTVEKMLSVTKRSLTPGRSEAMRRAAARGQQTTSLPLTNWLCWCVSQRVCPWGIYVKNHVGIPFVRKRHDNLHLPEGLSVPPRFPSCPRRHKHTQKHTHTHSVIAFI